MRFKQHFTLYPRKYNNGTQIWYYRTYTSDGKRTSGTSTGLRSKAKAQAFCEQLFKDGLLTTSDLSDKPLKFWIKDFFNPESEWVKDKLAQQTDTLQILAPKTLKFYESFFRVRIYPYFENIQVKDFNVNTLKQFRNHLLESGLSRYSTNACFNVLAIVAKSLFNDQVITQNPFDFIEPLKCEKSKRGAFTLEDAKLILNSQFNKLDNKIAITIAAFTGMRINEVMAISKDSLHKDYLDVTFQVNTEAKTKELKICKTQLPRNVPIIPEIYDLINFNLDPVTGLLFPSTNSDNVYYGLKSLMLSFGWEERIKKEKLSVHSWRHFKNTYLLAENVPGVKVDAVIGHVDKEKTMQQIYTNWRVEYLAEIYEADKKLWKYIFN